MGRKRSKIDWSLGLTQTGMAIALSYKTQNGATTVATVIAATAVHYPVAARTKTSNILVH